MGAADFFSNIDLHNGQILNVVVDPRTGEVPTTGTQGQLITIGGVLYIYTGTAWKALATGGDTDQIRADLTALENKVGTTTIAGDSVTAAIAAIQTSDYATSGIDSDKVAQIATNPSDIATINSSDVMNSGITGTKVSQYDAYATGKQDTLTTAQLAAVNSGFTATDYTRLQNVEAGAEVNVIEAITIDGTAQTITNKTAALDLSAYAKKSDVSSALTYKGTVANSGALPPSASVGDVYNVTNAGGTDEHGTPIKAGDNVAWSGTGWDVLGGTTDLSDYLTIASAQSTYEPKLTGTKLAAVNSGINSDKVAAYDAYDAEIDGKVDKLATKPTAGSYTKVTINTEGQVTAGTTLAASDIPTGIPQANIENLTSDLAGKVPKIASATGSKLVKSNADGTIAEDADATTKLAGIAAGAQVNVIEIVNVNGTAATVIDKAISLTIPTNNNELTNGAGYQTASDVSDAITTALGDYYAKTDVNGMFGEANLTFSNGTATLNIDDVWTASVLTQTTNEVVYCEVLIASDRVTVNISSATPEVALKLRYIKKP